MYIRAGHSPQQFEGSRPASSGQDPETQTQWTLPQKSEPRSPSSRHLGLELTGELDATHFKDSVPERCGE